MHFENWWASKYPAAIDETGFALVREAWNAGAVAEREAVAKRSKTAYMDGVDWQHHVEHDTHGVRVYPSQDSTIKGEPCAKDCGVVRVLMTEADWPLEQNLCSNVADERRA